MKTCLPAALYANAMILALNFLVLIGDFGREQEKGRGFLDSDKVEKGEEEEEAKEIAIFSLSRER